MAAAGSALAAVTVSGAVREPRTWTVPDLGALPQHELDVVYTCRSTGPRSHRMRGPLLRDALALAVPEFAGEDRKARLRYFVALLASDGHRAVLSWGEIDPEFGNGPIVLGLVRDGLALDLEGPHLAVPGDSCGARNVSGVVAIRLDAYSGQ
ncbi:hypothetical protein [Glycomyces sp. NPDC047010]|uniref:hypothetical protein n=1 Tax=Glycomyces sp. NPDC047010 TaxID=3155023 RepID=UPI0033DE9CA9